MSSSIEQSPIYLTQVVDGKTQLYKVDFTRTLPQEVIMGTQIIEEEHTIFYDNRRFIVSTYVANKKLIRSIHCDLLKWHMPLVYEPQDDAFRLSTEADADQHEVWLVKPTLIIMSGDDCNNTSYQLYLSDATGNAYRVSNVYDDGRICLSTDTITCNTPVQNIIAEIESVPGNSDLIMAHDDLNNSKYTAIPLYIHTTSESKQVVAARPYLQQRLNNECQRYIPSSRSRY
ncbi:MAG: hypothetical protein ACPIG6_07675 [Akkermansiaceae bacterium]